MLRCYDCTQLDKRLDLLLSVKAEVNHINGLGCTALHYAALNNDVFVVTSLLSHGASPMFELAEHLSPSLPCPLYLATSEEVTNVFTSHSDCPLSCKIDSLLLIGAATDDYFIRKKTWRQAITLREEHGITPPGQNSINGTKEIRNVNELEKCLEEDNDIEQSLLIIERCLGYFHNLDELDGIFSTVEEFLDDITIGMKCLELIPHCLHNTMLPHWSIGTERYWRSQVSILNKILDKLERKMSEMYGNGELSFLHVQRYAELCIDIVKALNDSYNTALCTKSTNMRYQSQGVIWASLGVLVHWLSWLSVPSLTSDDDRFQPLKRTVQKLVDQSLYIMSTTLLHLVPNYFSYDSVDDLIHLYELILQSDGADSAVNFVSCEGNRPLHCVAKGTEEPKHLSLILSLCENGAHSDAVDKKGKTARDYLIEAGMISGLEQLMPPSPLRLACLASHTIVKENIPYQEMDIVPLRMKKYVALHDPACCVYSDL